jgi:glycosyltransferase involved in cell wall biosynthesis
VTADDIRFSVVVATYNRGALIVPTIRSALQQHHPPHEIIVVGDGCTDDTGDVLTREFGGKVIWFNRTTNGGSQSFANNDGIARATGTHIAYLGHDDIWSPDHLAALAGVFTHSAVDVAVSGTLHYTPPGCDVWRVSGIFEEPAAARSEFFPPSSIGHRRGLTDRIGPWRDPATISAAVDWELQQRALAAGCRYASTARVTVHKFVGANWYLSYRFPSAVQQAEMLARLAEPDFEQVHLAGILSRVSRGGIVTGAGNYSGAGKVPGQLFRFVRAMKGLDGKPPVAIDRTTTLEMDRRPGSFDWHPVERSVRHGEYRWSGRNPNPVWLVNAHVARACSLRIPIVVSDPAFAVSSLRPLIDDQPVNFEVTALPEGGFSVDIAFPTGLPARGVKLTFQTWLPGAPVPLPRDRRFALGRITVVIEDAFARALRQPLPARRRAR